MLQFFPEVAQNSLSFPRSQKSLSIPGLWPPCTLCYQLFTAFCAQEILMQLEQISPRKNKNIKFATSLVYWVDKNALLPVQSKSPVKLKMKTRRICTRR